MSSKATIQSLAFAAQHVINAIGKEVQVDDVYAAEIRECVREINSALLDICTSASYMDAEATPPTFKRTELVQMPETPPQSCGHIKRGNACSLFCTRVHGHKMPHSNSNESWDADGRSVPPNEGRCPSECRFTCQYAHDPQGCYWSER